MIHLQIRYFASYDMILNSSNFANNDFKIINIISDNNNLVLRKLKFKSTWTWVKQSSEEKVLLKNAFYEVFFQFSYCQVYYILNVDAYIPIYVFLKQYLFAIIKIY